jgi:cardiolipin synthase
LCAVILYWLAGRTGRFCRDFYTLNLPNLITTARILCVPLIVWAITAGHMLPAFLLFLVAGISDAVDGFLAKRFNMATELGALLDPIADKALIVSLGLNFDAGWALPALIGLVTILTLLSIGFYVAEWIRHFGTNGAAH